MNEHAPKTTGLQVALILSVMLALILGVTAYLLYQENQELKQRLEGRNLPQANLFFGHPKYKPAASQAYFDGHAPNPSPFLLVSCSERYNRI